MLKDKTFLFGLGLGLIIAVLLLQLTQMRSGAEEKLFASDLNGPQVSSADLTQDIVMNWAEANQFKLISASELLYTEAEFDQAVENARQEAGALAVESPDFKAIRGFVIPNGATSSQVANLLKEMELIEDIIAFEDTMAIRGLHSKIQPGYYEFEGSPSLDEVIVKITSM